MIKPQFSWPSKSHLHSSIPHRWCFHSALIFFTHRSCQYQRWVFTVTEVDLCSDNETQLISFASQMSPPQGNWNNTQSNHTDMINDVLRLESSGIYIISRGELAIFISALRVNSSPVSAWLCCIVLNSWFLKGLMMIGQIMTKNLHQSERDSGK